MARWYEGPEDGEFSIPYQDVSSSNVQEVAWDEPTATLGVKFLNGSEYWYAPVTESQYIQVLTGSKNGSVGQSLHAFIKLPGIPYSREG